MGGSFSVLFHFRIQQTSAKPNPRMVASRHHIAVDEELHGKGIFVDYFVALRAIKAETLRDGSSGDEGDFNSW